MRVLSLSLNAARRFSTISSALALAAGGKYLFTYCMPSASPRSLSVTLSARFQRGWICFAPVMTSPRKRKFSVTKAELNQGAAAFTTCHRRYVFQSATGTSIIMALTSLKKPGCSTLIGPGLDLPIAEK